MIDIDDPRYIKARFIGLARVKVKAKAYPSPCELNMSPLQPGSVIKMSFLCIFSPADTKWGAYPILESMSFRLTPGFLGYELNRSRLGDDLSGEASKLVKLTH